MILIRNFGAVVLGLAIGGAVNMAIIFAGSSLIPPPPGVDSSDMESIRTSIHLYGVRHFISPLLAHALGTLTGALAAFLIAVSYRRSIAYGIGLVFLAGGIIATLMIPAPYWFIGLDLIIAYLPMAAIAIYLGRRLQKINPPLTK